MGQVGGGEGQVKGEERAGLRKVKREDKGQVSGGEGQMMGEKKGRLEGGEERG